MKNLRILLRGLFIGLSLMSPSLLCAASPATRQRVHLDEIAFFTGYARGVPDRSGEEYVVVPAGMRLGFDLRSLFGMEKSPVKLQLAMEPFVDAVRRPDSGVETGIGIFIRTHVPVTPSVTLVPEAGSGPVYLGIDTREQGDAAFNFLSQFGLGVQVALDRNSALTIGYRFRHLSNAGTRQPNDGINTDAVVISYSLLR